MSIRIAVSFLALIFSVAVSADDGLKPTGDPVSFTWGVKIPLRDGVNLSATVYRPLQQPSPLPCIFTLTPYIAQSYHDRGMYFAAHGYVFLTVDVRGRGNSEGQFSPFLQESKDGYDTVEWLAKQPYCNGKVTMWGGSYAGYDQWATAKEFPPHLSTIVPVASPYAGVDFPRRGNMAYPYDVQWLTFTSGHTSQDKIFADNAFWTAKFSELYLGHRAFKELDSVVGNPSPIFQSWVAHPAIDAYWDAYNPTAADFAKIDLPILTISGQYDGDQPGALTFYREHFRNASAPARAKHFLVMGPWDHPGTRTPRAEVGGLKFGAASLLDMNKLHQDWYDWTMKGGSKPSFLKDAVAYYVLGIGAEEWRYAPSLEAITSEARPLFLTSQSNASDLFSAGMLSAQPLKSSAASDHYTYDPLDVTSAPIDQVDEPNGLIDQRILLHQSGKMLVYHTAAFAKDIDIAGFFKLTAFMSLDQPDTDFHAQVFEILGDGSSILLSDDMVRARYRQSSRVGKAVTKGAIEQYTFDHFTFAARRIQQGSRLRLVIAPMNSMFAEKNYNAGGVVADETGKDAKTVVVNLFHDAGHQSILYVPIASGASSMTH